MYVHEGRGERIREEECGGERESMEKEEEDGEREGGMGDWGRRERRKRKSQEEREGEILDPGACTSVWVYGQDLLVPFSFCFSFSFLFSLLPPSFFLPLPLPFIPLFYHPFLFLLPPLLLSTISPPPSLSTAIQSRDG